MFGLFYPIFLNRTGGNSFCKLGFLSDAVFGIYSDHIFRFYWRKKSKTKIYLINRFFVFNYVALETKIQVFSLVFYNLYCAIVMVGSSNAIAS